MLLLPFRHIGKDDPEAIARIQAAIRENEENLSAGLRNIEAERKGQALSGLPSARSDEHDRDGRFQKDGMEGLKKDRRIEMEELEKSDAENDEEMPVAGPERLLHFTVSALLLQVTEVRLRHMYIRSRS